MSKSYLFDSWSGDCGKRSTVLDAAVLRTKRIIYLGYDTLGVLFTLGIANHTVTGAHREFAPQGYYFL